jgi:hypothetical protein
MSRDQSLVFEFAKRLPHRHDADAVVLGEVFLDGQTGRVAWTPSKDAGPQVLRDLVPERQFPIERERWRPEGQFGTVVHLPA